MKKIPVLILVMVLSACSSSGKKSTEKLYYRFPEANILVLDKEILIKRPTAMGIIGNRPMVVQNSDGALKQMHYNFWLDSPKVLLHNYLIKTFSTQSLGKAHILNSQILKLEKRQQTALIEIKFTLDDWQGNQILSKSYNQEAQLENKSIPQFAKAIAKMLEHMVNQLAEDIR